jgi:serine/threonine protein phosphatase 1
VSGRLFAVGDIHGCLAELETLLDGLSLATGDTLVFVGDYMDRGPDSRRVLDRCIDLGARTDITTVFLKGNHEDMCLDYIGRAGRWGEAWLGNGGAATLRSYGIDPRSGSSAALAGMPDSHLGFLDALRPSLVEEGWLFVHAGIRPDRTWAAQDEEDLYWIREEFVLRPHGLPQTIVFGHTPHRSVLVDLPYKVGIDTGCVYGGALTALELPDRTVHQVRSGERRVRTGALPASSRRRA